MHYFVPNFLFNLNSKSLKIYIYIYIYIIFEFCKIYSILDLSRKKEIENDEIIVKLSLISEYVTNMKQNLLYWDGKLIQVDKVLTI